MPDGFMILHVIDKVCSSCCCLFIHSMVTHQSATDGATAGVETQCGECFYQWPVAMQCLSQEERKDWSLSAQVPKATNI